MNIRLLMRLWAIIALILGIIFAASPVLVARDRKPPTTPGNLRDNGMSFEDGETWPFWEQSTDNVDPQSVIRYDVYVNGVFDHSLMGFGRAIVYGNAGVENTYQVIAVDSAGNQSVPATLTTCAGAIC